MNGVDGDLHGKVALLAAARRGIGKQVAIEVGRRGASIVVAARTVQPHRRLPGTIGETVGAIEAVGASAWAVQADMAVPMNIMVVNVHPGFVRTELTEVLGGQGVDITESIPVDVPTQAIAYVVTCDDPMAYTGTVLSAEELMVELGAGA